MIDGIHYFLKVECIGLFLDLKIYREFDSFEKTDICEACLTLSISFTVAENEKASIDGIQDLTRNGQINSVDGNGYTALHWAAMKGNYSNKKM